MNRRRLVLTATSAAALSTAAALGQDTTVQAARTSVPQYVGALTIMRRQADWVLQEVTALLDTQDRDDEEWRIDVLAPFAVVVALRQSGRTVVPPGRSSGVPGGAGYGLASMGLVKPVRFPAAPTTRDNAMFAPATRGSPDHDGRTVLSGGLSPKNEPDYLRRDDPPPFAADPRR